MTVKLADTQRLLDNVRTNTPGALDGAILLEVFNVLSDFFNRTNCWWEDVMLPVSVANVCGSTIEAACSEGGRINRLLGVYVDSVRSPRRMAMPTPGTLLFIDVPNGDETWTARLALSAADPVAKTGELTGFPQAPDWVLTRYHQGLTAGVIANMLSQVGKPYSNIKMAGLHMSKYMRAVSEATTETRRQNLFAAQAWRYPAFA